MESNTVVKPDDNGHTARKGHKPTAGQQGHLRECSASTDTSRAAQDTSTQDSSAPKQAQRSDQATAWTGPSQGWTEAIPHPIAETETNEARRSNQTDPKRRRSLW